MARKSKTINTKITPLENGQIDLSLTCKKCGKPISHSDEYGMFCEDNCGRQEAIKSQERIFKIFPFLKK